MSSGGPLVWDGGDRREGPGLGELSGPDGEGPVGGGAWEGDGRVMRGELPPGRTTGPALPLPDFLFFF